MNNVDQRDTDESSQGTSTMVQIDKKGRERIHQIQRFSVINDTWSELCLNSYPQPILKAQVT